MRQSHIFKSGQRISRIIISAAVILLAVLVLTGAVTAASAGITVTPGSITFNYGAARQNVVIYDETFLTTSVTAESSNVSVASVGDVIGSNGVFTCQITPVNSGSATITFTADGVTDTLSITVTERPLPTVDKFVYPESNPVDVKSGSVVTFYAYPFNITAGMISSQPVTVDCNPNIGTAYIGSNYLVTYTAPTVTDDTPVRFTFSITGSSPVANNTYDVNVKKPVLTTLTHEQTTNKTLTSLNKFDEFTLIGIGNSGTYSFAPSELSWTISNESVVEKLSNTSDTATFRATNSGTATITATSTNGKTSAQTVTVVTPGAPVIQITPSSPVLVGTTNIYTAVVTSSDDISSFTWGSITAGAVENSNSTISPYTINVTFNVAGDYHISASAVSDKGVSGTADIIITVRSQEYNITLPGQTGGTVTASKSKAVEGEHITLTASPSANYAFSSYTVTGSGGPVTVSGNSFTMPAYDVAVTATFRSTGGGGGGGSGGGSASGGSSGSSSGNVPPVPQSSVISGAVPSSGVFTTGDSQGITSIVFPDGTTGTVVVSKNAAVPALPSGTMKYESYDITGPSGGADISFSVPESELTSRGLSAVDVCLMHYVNGAWKYETTYYLGTVNGVAKYSSKVSEFSPFAVAFVSGKATDKSSGTQSTVPATPTQSKPTEQSKSPLGVVGLLLGGITAAAVISRRK